MENPILVSETYLVEVNLQTFKQKALQTDALLILTKPTHLIKTFLLPSCRQSPEAIIVNSSKLLLAFNPS